LHVASDTAQGVGHLISPSFEGGAGTIACMLLLTQLREWGICMGDAIAVLTWCVCWRVNASSMHLSVCLIGAIK